MKKKRLMSMILSFIMLFTMVAVVQPAVYAAGVIPYSGIDVSSGHAFPINVILGENGKLYVSEYSANKIIEMDRDGQNKVTLDSGMSQPIGMVFDASGNLYIAEHNGSKISKIDQAGHYAQVKYVGGRYFTGIVLDSQGKIITVDYSNGRILKMDPDGSNFEELVTGLTKSSLIGMTIDEYDNLYVCDRNNNKVIKITPGGTVNDFISQVKSPIWVTLGKDGFFYVSTGDRMIVKANGNGDHIAAFSTDTLTPWGVSVDKGGYIYFTEAKSTTKKIVGMASTIDTNHIALTMNTTLDGMQADPSAFSISGVASNPQVTAAITSDSTITLTLSSAITTLDTNIRVNYAKTGTDDLAVLSSHFKVDDFSNLVVTNKIASVMSTENIPQINVVKGTAINAINLPKTVMLNLSNAVTTSAAITWNNGTPTYNGELPGTYAFEGTLEVGGNISNPYNVKAHVNVVVQAESKPNVIAVEHIPSITVSNGTSITSIGLSTSANIQLSNLTTSSAIIIWDGGTPAYNGNRAGTYHFQGTLDLGDEFFNPNNLIASVDVNVQPAGSSNSSNDSNSAASSTANAVPEVHTLIKINGKSHSIANETKTTVNGVSRVEVSIVSSLVEKVIDAIVKDNQNNLTESKNVIEASVSDTTAKSAVIGLTGEIVKKLDQENFDIRIQRGQLTYNIPAKELTVDAVAEKLGISPDKLSSIKFEIQMEQLTSDQQANVNEKIKANNSEMLVAPSEFNIVARVTKSNGEVETVSINSFMQYVERIFELSSNIDFKDVTTGIVFNADATYEHVPTNVFVKNNKIYAKINSLTNSTYSVIKNNVKVESTEGHWAERVINDMASRLVIEDYNHFKPNVNITRGELAEYIVKALGLYRADSNEVSQFKDVNSTDENAIAIALASEWKIIGGYPDGKFNPNAQVTRQEAMVMYSRAMDIVKYPKTADSSNTERIKDKNISAWSAPFVQRVVDGQIFVGRSNKDLGLKENLTHAEALTALKNILTGSNLINNK